MADADIVVVSSPPDGLGQDERDLSRLQNTVFLAAMLAIVVEVAGKVLRYFVFDGNREISGLFTLLALLLWGVTTVHAMRSAFGRHHMTRLVAVGSVLVVLGYVSNLLGRFYVLDVFPIPAEKQFIHHIVNEAFMISGLGLFLFGFYFSLLDAARNRLRQARDSAELQRQISERIRFETALRESEQKFRRLVETLPHTISIIQDRKIVFANGATARALGLPGIDSVIGRDPLDFVAETERDRVRETMEARFGGSEGLPQNYETVIRRANGEMYPSWQTILMVEYEGRPAEQIVGIDISEQKKTEEALRLAENRYRELFENANDIIYTHDLSGRITSVNKAGQLLLGYSREELLEMNLEQFVAPEYQDISRRMIWQKVDGATRTSYEVEVVTRNSERFWIEVSTRIIYENGQPAGVQGIARDITGRKLAEEARRQSEEKYQTILDSIEEGYYEVDLDGNLTFYNESLVRILRLPKNQMRGMNYRRFHISGENTRKAFRAFNQVFKTGMTVRTSDWEIIRGDGSTASIELSITLIKDKNDKPSGFRGIVRDVTDRRHAETQRREMENRFQQAQKLESLGVLAGGIAHDFNNLLVGILGNTELMQLRLPDDSPVRKNLDHIEKSARRAAELTNQMLAYSGKGAFIVEKLDASHLVRSMASLLQTVVSKKVTIEYQLGNHLPAINADASQARQIIMNLVTNASDAIGEEEGIVRIATGVLHADKQYLSRTYLNDNLQEGYYVYVDVSDNGCGMNLETQNRIFDPFFTTKFMGRGLGLPATLGIIRGHNGAIKVYSEEGAGTTVRVLMPCAESEDSIRVNYPDLVDSEPVEAPSSVGGPVLVVDDEDYVRSVAQEILEEFGFAVVTAQDGVEALEMLERTPEINLVLLDLMMPRMNGQEALQEIRKRYPALPVVLSSGYTERDAVQRFQGDGPAAFIQKPYMAQQLVSAVRRALNKPNQDESFDG